MLDFYYLSLYKNGSRYVFIHQTQLHTWLTSRGEVTYFSFEDYFVQIFFLIFFLINLYSFASFLQ